MPPRFVVLCLRLVIHRQLFDKSFWCGMIIPHFKYINIKFMKNLNLKKFGELLKDLRMKRDFSLRDICKKVNYDPSNWSKIERGLISPPNDETTLSRWTSALGLRGDSAEYYNFIDLANIAQGIIPDYIMQEKDLVLALPAFFRTVRNEKPTKKEIDGLINLIKNS